MRAHRADAAAQLETLANHVGQLVQDFRQVAARALLQQDRRHEEMHVQRRYALRKFLQRHFDRQPQVVFLKGPPELARHRLLKFAVNHFERYRECVTSAHGARYELQRVRENFLEVLQARLAFQMRVDRRTRSRRDSNDDRQRLPDRQHEPAQSESAEKQHQRQVHKSRRRPFQAGLFQKFFELGPPLILIDDGLRELVLGGVGLVNDLLLARCHGRQQLFVELGTDSGGGETAHHLPVRIETALFKHEQILQRDHFAFHAGHFGQRNHAAGAIAQARRLHQQVHCAGDLLPDRDHLHVRIGQRNHDFETRHRVAGGIGVHRGQRSVVTRVHGL